ncbi:MAG TPA: helix-turn-helix domain-containing protein [Actinophytocola sp.]|nr:helix-turn-helix domain-containing protein [Actinophytocola sp.]
MRRFLGQTGGIRPQPTRPAPAQLSLVERGKISRGIVAGISARAIAVMLGRPGSPVSREIAWHGGRESYRAHDAHTRVALNRRRPKTKKLASAP